MLKDFSFKVANGRQNNIRIHTYKNYVNIISIILYCSLVNHRNRHVCTRLSTILEYRFNTVRAWSRKTLSFSKLVRFFMQESNESFLNDWRVVIALLLRSLFQNEKERMSQYFFRVIPVAASAKTTGPPGELMYL